ncbi:SoxR reducing system RseC family protein [Clostridium sp. WILCCON 0269]|uniref:SoxR reducing system RseC family protein n=1 Tax=Candidatus Clostridium eludens TaxID=3381663 RepID=A0ABW8SG43_9CLOT
MGKNHEIRNKRKSTNMVMAAFMLFILPIVFVFIGIFSGGYIGKVAEGSVRVYQVMGGIIAFILALILIKLFDKATIVDENQEKFHWEDM